MFAIVICLVLLMCTLTILSYVLCVLMVKGMSVVVNVMSLMSEVVLVPYVDAVTVMRVLLFVLHVFMLRECDGAGNAVVGDCGGVVAVSAGCEYMVATRGSGLCLFPMTC